ncbi:hypothetical protein BSQ39_00860 [Loigolactobacillus backii]|uniref:hypothetical protein n=1 Tax=Loigolactobacillus backii TaxID=375175 RepID=UPI000C1CB86D|nr:hypothetical protein [Loigolactobacillus backii]PIO82209.1 hypothetical protein BSQ39_00860 [Loigolactobacillus backii]
MDTIALVLLILIAAGVVYVSAGILFEWFISAIIFLSGIIITFIGNFLTLLLQIAIRIKRLFLKTKHLLERVGVS